jgi:LysR family nitrogen assimilation transcriptional regulator
MDLKQLDYFVHVADARSFSQAAELLHIAQPALSRQVRRLEVELRQTLFVRTGRGVTLTPAGKRLLEHARGILEQVQRARADLDESRDSHAGRVIIGMPPTIGRAMSAKLVAEFRARFPRTTMSIVEGLTVHVLEWLTMGRIDAGIVYNAPSTPQLQLMPLVEQALCLVGVGRATGELESIALQDLPKYPLIIPSRPHTIRMFVDWNLALLGLKPTIGLEVDSLRGMLDLVQGGHGYAVLARQALIEAGSGAALWARPIVRPPLRIVVSLGVHAERPLTPLTRETVKLVQSLAKPILADSAFDEAAAQTAKRPARRRLPAHR